MLFRSHYPRSQSLSEMYCSRSAGSGPAQDQKRLSFGELASAHQTDMRRVIWHDEARSLCIIERIRHEIGRAHVGSPGTNAQDVCRLRVEKEKIESQS